MCWSMCKAYEAFSPMCCTFQKKLLIYCCFKTLYLSIVLSAMLDIARNFYFILVCVWRSINLHLLQRLQPLTTITSLSLHHKCFRVSSFEFNLSLNVRVHLFSVSSSMCYLTWGFTSFLSPRFLSSKFNVSLIVRVHFFLVSSFLVPSSTIWVALKGAVRAVRQGQCGLNGGAGSFYAMQGVTCSCSISLTPRKRIKKACNSPPWHKQQQTGKLFQNYYIMVISL